VRRFLAAALIAATLALTTAACSSLRIDGNELDGTSWRAVSVAGQTPAPGHEPTLVFDGGKVRGNAGCNGYVGQGPARIVDGRLDIGETLITLAGCVDDHGRTTPWGELEPTFMLLLSSGNSIARRGDLLVVASSRGELIFELLR
jgi:heat shock protein HslJ